MRKIFLKRIFSLFKKVSQDDQCVEKTARDKLVARPRDRIRKGWSSTPWSDTWLDKVSSLGIGNRAIGRVIGRTSRAASQSLLSERLIKRSSSTVLSEEADLTSTVDSFGWKSNRWRHFSNYSLPNSVSTLDFRWKKWFGTHDCSWQQLNKHLSNLFCHR